MPRPMEAIIEKEGPIDPIDLKLCDLLVMIPVSTRLGNRGSKLSSSTPRGKEDAFLPCWELMVDDELACNPDMAWEFHTASILPQ